MPKVLGRNRLDAQGQLGVRCSAHKPLDIGTSSRGICPACERVERGRFTTLMPQKGGQRRRPAVVKVLLQDNALIAFKGCTEPVQFEAQAQAKSPAQGREGVVGHGSGNPDRREQRRPQRQPQRHPESQAPVQILRRGPLVVRWEVCGVARCVGHEVIGVLQVSTAGQWFVLAFSPTVRGGPMTQSANLPDV